jgi:hypothetical protein
MTEAYILFLVLAVLVTPKAFALVRGSDFVKNSFKVQWRDLFWGTVVSIIPFIQILALVVSTCVIFAHVSVNFRRPSWWRKQVFPLTFPSKKVKDGEWLKF